ncbi:YczE/YyaS/YitT family protein [Paracoccus sp. KR1-242]|uniref:YczE/YyaS/YitT family protein n=1 Tax=Paracoccus sp. KR1-242 TaxID=3410028 RepID=UPI003C04FAF3
MDHGSTAEAEIVDTGSLKRRWIIYVVGIYLLTLGVSMAIRAGIGISPQSSLTRTMTLVFPPLSQGTYNFCLELIMLALTFLILPKGWEMKNFASLIPAFVLALCLDFNLKMTGWVQLDAYWAKVLLLLVGDAALAFGLFLMIRANLVLMPIDMFVNTIFKRTGWKWGNIKSCFDLTLLVMAALIGLAFLGEVKFIREGTLLNAIFVGQYIKLYFWLFKRLQARKTAGSGVTA